MQRPHLLTLRVERGGGNFHTEEGKLVEAGGAELA